VSLLFAKPTRQVVFEFLHELTSWHHAVATCFSSIAENLGFNVRTICHNARHRRGYCAKLLEERQQIEPGVLQVHDDATRRISPGSGQQICRVLLLSNGKPNCPGHSGNPTEKDQIIAEHQPVSDHSHTPMTRTNCRAYVVPLVGCVGVWRGIDSPVVGRGATATTAPRRIPLAIT